MSSTGDREPPLKRYRRREEEQKSDNDDLEKEGEDYVPYVPVRERRKQKLVKLGRIAVLKETEKTANSDLISSGASSAAEEETNEDIIRKEAEILAKSQETSLLLQHSQLKKLAEAKQESEVDKLLKEEDKILESVKAQTALMGAAELAKGVQYVDPIRTSWKVPRYININYS